MNTKGFFLILLLPGLCTATYSQQKVELPDRGKVGVTVNTGFYGRMGIGVAAVSHFEYHNVNLSTTSFSFSMEAGNRLSKRISLFGQLGWHFAPKVQEITVWTPDATSIVIKSFGGGNLNLGTKIHFGKGSAYVCPMAGLSMFGPNGDGNLLLYGPGGTLALGYSNNITGKLNYDFRLYGKYGELDGNTNEGNMAGSAFLVGFEIALMIGP